MPDTRSLHRPLACLLTLLGACSGGDDSGGDGSIDVELPYTVVDSDQLDCYDLADAASCPNEGEDYYGQDAQYLRNAPSYTDNGDGTVTDDNTGLVWQQSPPEKMAYSEAEGYCEDLELGGQDDWRLPDIKSLYSLIQFDGATGTAPDEDFSQIPDDAVPYIDTDYFDFEYGDVDAGERYIDAQFLTSTVYASRVMADDDGLESGQTGVFGVNFADGRIKGYGVDGAGDWYFRCVRGNEDYGVNALVDNGDGTVTDEATGLMWTQEDSGGLGGGPTGDGTLDWGSALAFCEELEEAGHDDWRLPDAKELQTIVDYDRSPDTTGSAALGAVFEATAITVEDGHQDYGFYWTGTTHLDGMDPGTDAAYVAFGEALGYMEGMETGDLLFLDVHGAGAQRGDPKAGSPDDYPIWGGGPQGDVRRVHNLARCVRDVE